MNISTTPHEHSRKLCDNIGTTWPQKAKIQERAPSKFQPGLFRLQYKEQLRTNILENYATTLAPPGRGKTKSRREPPPDFNLAYSDYRPVVGLFKLKYAACTFFARQRMNYH